MKYFVTYLLAFIVSALSSIIIFILPYYLYLELESMGGKITDELDKLKRICIVFTLCFFLIFIVMYPQKINSNSNRKESLIDAYSRSQNITRILSAYH